jgi:hypothetical protein
VRLTDNWIASAGKPGGGSATGSGGGHDGGGEDSVGNNLSTPAIWSDGVAKELRGTPGEWLFEGESIDVGGRAWSLQQDSGNEWQAETLNAVSVGITPFYVDALDWGDNLEARNWNAGSQVRIETVLYQDMTSPANAMTGYEMRYLYGERSTEMWGTSGVTFSTADPDAATNPLKSTDATVYSRCARLTIQKLIGTRENPGSLAWDPALGQWNGAVEPPDFNRGVWEAGEGPDRYSAEINVRGRLIYGFNWRVADLHPVDTAGDYRLTFSVDGLGPDPTGAHCDVALNTDLSMATILSGSEEGEGGGGGIPVVDMVNNLSYIDVRILPGSSGSDVSGNHGDSEGGTPDSGDAHDGEQEEKNLVKDVVGNLVEQTEIENGSVGASRPNLALVSNTAIVAYEESKGAGQPGLVSGKFVRYHMFPFQTPPEEDIGCIISDPAENGRRVRLVTQGTPGPETGLRWVIFWRQGIGGQGAPADIVLRMGTSNFTPDNLSPAVDPGCATSLFEEASLLQNQAPYNVSSNTPVATTANLYDTTAANSVENSRAHRALLRGDNLYVGYTYTEDDLLSQLMCPRTNYNYWLRHFDAVSGSWAAPTNLSKISNRYVDAKEPRLTGTPGSGPDCPNNPQECQNPDIFFAAWGTELKDPAAGVAKNLDLFITFTTDSGKAFAPEILLARGDKVNGQA